MVYLSQTVLYCLLLRCFFLMVGITCSHLLGANCNTYLLESKMQYNDLGSPIGLDTYQYNNQCLETENLYESFENGSFEKDKIFLHTYQNKLLVQRLRVDWINGSWEKNWREFQCSAKLVYLLY